MWLLPLFPAVARTGAWIYYRIRYRGGAVPAGGPVLLVANHPNSLLDPMLVVAAARRPVRFLAKAPLFTDARVGWLVRASGAIPVYRRQDDPTALARNDEMFRAVHEALAAGDAVALFPEGISHSEPSLAPLKTGAARIALGAAHEIGGPFPIVPVGLVLRQKEIFRSEGLVLVGASLDWQDLADRGVDDGEAVRELTSRIDEALRHQTVNLEAWHDEPLVETALRIWEAEAGVRFPAPERLERLATVTRMLAAIRVSHEEVGLALARAVHDHQRRLARVGLRPADLGADTGGRRAFTWAVARLPLVLPLWLLVGVAGWLLFLVPYRLTGVVVDRLPLERDTRSTWKLMVGAMVYTAWVILVSAATWRLWTPWAGVAVLGALPLVGMTGLLVRERWRGSWQDARRWLLLRSRRSLMDTLRTAQRELATRLDNRYRDFVSRGAA
jgi:1-acyl-sn-glycerol-3-phosphate acyltransferase